MSARRRVLALTALAALIAAPAAGGQEWKPLATDIFTTLRWTEVSVENRWRGIERGYGGLRVGAAYAHGTMDTGSITPMLEADAQTAIFDRSKVSDRAQLSASLVRRGARSWLWLTAEGSALPVAADRRLGAEVALGARAPVPRWFPERHPTFVLDVSRDLARYEATYVRTALRLDYKFHPLMGAFVEAGQAWSELPVGEESGRRPFGAHGTDVVVTLDRSNAAGSTAYEPFIRAAWMAQRCGAAIDVGLRTVAVR